MVIQLFMPMSSSSSNNNNNNSNSNGKLPVFLTQWNHRSWAVRAARRGYLAVLYPGGDTNDIGPEFAAAYPTATWMVIMRRAWVASRVVDYIVRLPQVNTSAICISGHSRNGKQSFMAAAFDTRIAAVVSSSSGTPIAAPVRFSSSQFQGETTQFVQPSRDWWVQTLNSYYGRENELPIDGHAVTALIAPRYALFATAHNDHSGDMTFADERNFLAAREVGWLVGWLVGCVCFLFFVFCFFCFQSCSQLMDESAIDFCVGSNCYL